ncbi:ankyrin repeat domain-containing protein 13C isoform X2 [Takifugu flavidus]|uniref:ankyrin repeat domain-containing protein 13C isoform X2 n=1 Tax=Takifugu flavidus TaxID=433684 RepID=UPI002544BD1A|nr:ankyrin repeat domain-containing protein 13C isoform X2 [Takifugu flavidus]
MQYNNHSLVPKHNILMSNHAFVNEPNGCLQVQINDVAQVQSTPNDVSRTLAILPCGKHQLNLRTCPPELLLFFQPRTTPFGLKGNGAFHFHGSVVPGDVFSFVSRRLTCPSKEGGRKKKCFHVQFTVCVGRLPSGGSLQFTRRVIVSDDALCSLNLNWFWKMTGEKIRTLRKDHGPSKDEGLLEPDEEAATGTFTAPKTSNKSRASKIFSNHKLIKSPSTQQQHNQHAQSNAKTSSLQTSDVIDDNNKNPLLRTGPDFPVHECVFKGDVRRLSSLIRTQSIAQKDIHGNTPLHLAVMMGHKVTALLRKLKQQSRESVEDKRPKLLKALKELGDFYLELHWDFQSWVPLLSRILPSDACKIYKQGLNIRLDTTLTDFTDMKCQRGDLSFIFNGNAVPSESFVVLDNEQRVYQRIHHEESEMETEEEVDILMSSDVYSATLSTKSITFSRAQTGWLFREDKTERVGNFLADFYSVNGLVLESRKRREHLSEEDILRNKAIMESLSKGGNLIEQNFEPVRRQSLTPPSPNIISWEEYITADNGKPPHLGRELVCKESKKNFKATIAMSQDFPLGIESLLNVLEVIAPFKHFNKLREFVQMKLPPGFPVKLDIPVFPTITATVTFQQFRYDEFDQSTFITPSDYKEDPSRFPDL